MRTQIQQIMSADKGTTLAYLYLDEVDQSVALFYAPVIGYALVHDQVGHSWVEPLIDTGMENGIETEGDLDMVPNLASIKIIHPNGPKVTSEEVRFRTEYLREKYKAAQKETIH